MGLATLHVYCWGIVEGPSKEGFVLKCWEILPVGEKERAVRENFEPVKFFITLWVKPFPVLCCQLPIIGAALKPLVNTNVSEVITTAIQYQMAPDQTPVSSKHRVGSLLCCGSVEIQKVRTKSRWKIRMIRLAGAFQQRLSICSRSAFFGCGFNSREQDVQRGHKAFTHYSVMQHRRKLQWANNALSA